MMLLLLIGASLAGTSLDRPLHPAPAPDECSQSTAIVKGKAIPPTLAVNGVAVCSAVAEPTGSLTYLLAVERYSIAADQLHAVQINDLETQVQALQQQQPWHKRPQAQRWLGRAEVAAVVALVLGGIWAVDEYRGAQ